MSPENSLKMQVGGKSCHPIPQVKCSSDHTHTECNLNYDSHDREVPFSLCYICTMRPAEKRHGKCTD